MTKENMLHTEVILEEGVTKGVHISVEELSNLLLEKIEKFNPTEMIDDILVTRKCLNPECGMEHELTLKRSSNDEELICLECGTFSPIQLTEEERNSNL